MVSRYALRVGRKGRAGIERCSLCVCCGSTDCSGFACAVYNEVLPEANLDPKVLGTSGLMTSALFETVSSPRAGDLVFWVSHVAIVIDPNKKICIHAPGKGKPVRYQDWTYMGLGPVAAFRSWIHLD